MANIECILFLDTLLRRENVNMSCDLKLDIKIDSRIKAPTMMSMFCFLKSSTFEPKRKNNATEAKIAAIMTIDKLRIIMLIFMFIM